MKVAHKKTFKKNGLKQDLELKVYIGKGSLVTDDNFEEGVVIARFPDNSVCELEGIGKSRKYYKYSLKVRTRNGVYQERKGFCESNDIPAYTGDSVVIEYDGDDDLATANTELARISF
ncbi:hypothetical protein U2W12_18735 [Methylomicrobium sp. Wu6]|nr:hypothetical protein [Methylomicrobium sp. Wu6]